jgi:hypothetical protein
MNMKVKPILKISIPVKGLSDERVDELIKQGAPKVLRFKVPAGQTVTIQDETTKPTRTSLPRPGATVGTTN